MLPICFKINLSWGFKCDSISSSSESSSWISLGVSSSDSVANNPNEFERGIWDLVIVANDKVVEEVEDDLLLTGLVRELLPVLISELLGCSWQRLLDQWLRGALDSVDDVAAGGAHDRVGVIVGGGGLDFLFYREFPFQLVQMFFNHFFLPL